MVGVGFYLRIVPVGTGIYKVIGGAGAGIMLFRGVRMVTRSLTFAVFGFQKPSGL